MFELLSSIGLVCFGVFALVLIHQNEQHHEMLAEILNGPERVEGRDDATCFLLTPPGGLTASNLIPLQLILLTSTTLRLSANAAMLS